MPNSDYKFVPTDAGDIVSALVTAYERITGRALHPADPDMLFLRWVADVIVQERVLTNYAGNQNIPSRASGENLDSLGELFYATERPQAQPAVCTERFYISEAQTTSILVPEGTRVTDMSNSLIWETVEDAYIAIGDTYTDVQVRCQTPGSVGNGYAKGQLSTIVDLYDYYSKCENITASDGGADEATDAEYYQQMRASMDAFSTAGPRGAYVYIAMQVSTEIADVLAVSPSAGNVVLYVLMNDGKAAGTEMKNAVLAACSEDTVRPLTDHVTVADPQAVEYDIAFTYYIPENTDQSAEEVEAAVDAAVQEYISWQSGKLGRDINPSYLIGLLMQTGVKRVVLTSPTYTALNNGEDGTTPQLAQVGDTTATNGGYEDE